MRKTMPARVTGPMRPAHKRKPRARLQEPLDYILSVMRDERADEKRRDAMAKEALPYRHAKLVGAAQPLKPLEKMTEAELEVISAKGKEKA